MMHLHYFNAVSEASRRPRTCRKLKLQVEDAAPRSRTGERASIRALFLYAHGSLSIMGMKRRRFPFHFSHQRIPELFEPLGLERPSFSMESSNPWNIVQGPRCFQGDSQRAQRSVRVAVLGLQNLNPLKVGVSVLAELV